MKTKRACKERFYPTSEQETPLAQSFGCARFVYNNTLRFRTDAYYKDGKSVSHSEVEKRLVSLKKEFLWLNDISSVLLQQCLRDQQEAFKNFWAGRAQYPNFKKKHSKQSIRLTKAAFKVKDGQLFIAKSKEPLNVRWSRGLSSEPSSITISKDRAGRYFVSMLCEFEAKPMPVSHKTVGIDLGLTRWGNTPLHVCAEGNLGLTSEGKLLKNPVKSQAISLKPAGPLRIRQYTPLHWAKWLIWR